MKKYGDKWIIHQTLGDIIIQKCRLGLEKYIPRRILMTDYGENIWRGRPRVLWSDGVAEDAKLPRCVQPAKVFKRTGGKTE